MGKGCDPNCQELTPFIEPGNDADAVARLLVLGRRRSWARPAGYPAPPKQIEVVEPPPWQVPVAGRQIEPTRSHE